MTSLAPKYDRDDFAWIEDSQENSDDHPFRPTVFDAADIAPAKPADLAQKLSERYGIDLLYTEGVKTCGWYNWSVSLKQKPGKLDYDGVIDSDPYTDILIDTKYKDYFRPYESSRADVGNTTEIKSDEASELENEFNKLASDWCKDTRRLSSANQMVLHPAYQQIIGMGRDALPFIFKELKKTRGHWIWALAMILRDDKAKPGMNFREAVDAWLTWGEDNGYII